MSKPVKQLVRDELIRRLRGVGSLAVVGFAGLDSVSTTRIRHRLRDKDIRLTVVRNSLARQAFRAVGLAAAVELLHGPCAIAHGADSVVTVVRELLAIQQESPELAVKSAVLEGKVFRGDQIDELSKYPTRQEAISRAVGCVLAAGSNLSGCLLGPGSRLASILKTIQDRQAPEAGEQAA